MIRLMRKPTICICENEDVDQLTAKHISAFVFATRILRFLFFPKFQASSYHLCMYSSVCIRPVQKPHCWFSHDAVQIVQIWYKRLGLFLIDSNDSEIVKQFYCSDSFRLVDNLRFCKPIMVFVFNFRYNRRLITTSSIDIKHILSLHN